MQIFYEKGSNDPSILWQYDTATYFYKGLCLNNDFQKKTVITKIVNTQKIRKGNVNSKVIADTLTNSYTAEGRLIWSRKGNLDGTITTTYENYLPTGVYSKKTVSAQGCSPRTETYEYDNTHRFVTKITNPDFTGFVTKFSYDAKTGNKTSETDINNLITTYTYDSFGNPVSVDYPDGTQTSTQVDWWTNSAIPNARYYTKTIASGMPEVRVYYDILGREVCRMQEDVFTDIRYNAKGEVIKTSYPYKGINTPDGSKIWNNFTYDNFGRKIREEAPYTDLSYSYNNRKITVTDHKRGGIESYKDYDALGRIIQAKDEGGIINYTYSIITSINKLRHQTEISTNGAVTTIETDLWGNRLLITEPNAGKITSTYNKFNELVKQVDARKNTTTYEYDQLGRVIQKIFNSYNAIIKGDEPTEKDDDRSNTPTMTLDYTYDNYSSSNRGRGKLHTVKIDDTLYETFEYDTKGRFFRSTKMIDNQPFIFFNHYNANGQLSKMGYPSYMAYDYSYENGRLLEIKQSINNNRIYKVESRNIFQMPLRCIYGNLLGTTTDYTYNPYGLLTHIRTHDGSLPVIINPTIKRGDNDLTYTIGKNMVNYRYEYDPKGLMTLRVDSTINRWEKFTYDNLDRLTQVTVGTTGQTNGTPQLFSYHNNGNMDINSEVGVYHYEHNKKVHAVTSIEPAIGNFSLDSCDVTYNFFNQPTKIVEGEYRLEIFYGANMQRHKVERYKNNVKENTRYYINKYYEKEIDHLTSTTRHFNYIYGDNGVVALNIITQISNGYNESMYYIHSDHLGSYNAITTNNGKVVQRNHFDVWGNPLPVYASTDTLKTTPLNFTLTNRGFTGHEHYPFFKIINMNGRLYDPVIAKFFSPDKYVANSSFTQDFNRYTYARNNPLMYTDPDGESIVLAVVLGAMVGAFINVAVNTASIETPGQFFAYMGLGALGGGLAGAAGFGVTSAMAVTGFVGGATAGAAAGALGGFINGAGNTWMQGGSFGQGLGAGLQSGAMGALIGGITGGLIGGIQAWNNGGSFWNGSFEHHSILPGKSGISWEQAQKNVEIYDQVYADGFDVALANLMESELNFKAGDLGFGTLTTRPSNNVGLTGDMAYVKPDGSLSAGYVNGIIGKPETYSMHISPKATLGDIVDFRAIAGHEIIHAYHISTFGSRYVSSYSEGKAYHYSYSVYSNAGRYGAALNILSKYSISYPSSYSIPSVLKWPIF